MRIALIVVALVAFAANSLLCRRALGGGLIDPTAFTTIRLVGGALVLAAFSGLFGTPAAGTARSGIGGSWRSAAALFGYALAFSWAYAWLDAGMGALVLFGAVQATMIGAGILGGERPRGGEWLGLVTALAGLVYLVLPGLTAPPLLGVALMAFAGWAWGVYSLRGRSAADAVRETAGNFLRAVPLAAAAFVVPWGTFTATWRGVALAALSGAVTSGLGYIVWYRALRELTATTAAIVQLLVPVLAALGGVVLLGELLARRLPVAGFLILGGVLTAILSRRR